MTHVIHKHAIPMDPGNVHEVSTGAFAKPITAAFQGNQLFFWEQHRSNVPPLPIWVVPLFTSQEFDLSGWLHLETVQRDGFVWHVYWTDRKEAVLR